MATSPFPGGVVGAATTVGVAGPPGVPWAAANITTETVQNATTGALTNVVDVYFFLATGATPNGSIQVDYTQNNDGSLTLNDQFFRNPDGSQTAVFIGNEATNPILTSVPGLAPANPGFVYTAYSISAAGLLTQVVAQDSTGHAYVGV